MGRENYFSANLYSRHTMPQHSKFIPVRCQFCGRLIKEGELYESIGVGFANHIYFHDGHLIKFFQKQRREFLLSKI